LVAYLLNPHYSYADNSLFDDATIIEGFITCVETVSKQGAFAKNFPRTYQNFDCIPGRPEKGPQPTCPFTILFGLL
jgi:hypothetical protein